MNSETEDYFYLNGETEFREAEEIRLWEKLQCLWGGGGEMRE